MDVDNPWQVVSIEAFYCLKCPECMYFTTDDNGFYNHAVENHPLSGVLFGKGFTKKQSLERHFKTVHKEEMFQDCPNCKILLLPQALDKHLKNCAKSNEYKCKRCNRSFDTSRGLVTHKNYCGRSPSKINLVMPVCNILEVPNCKCF